MEAKADLKWVAVEWAIVQARKVAEAAVPRVAVEVVDNGLVAGVAVKENN
ncbi:MAG: hypothetical protein HYZ52_05685 [Candidatus Omnitrophica bacterium]|nr:hypothetical protein [Candidatus Omnitrophota bacterium]